MAWEMFGYGAIRTLYPFLFIASVIVWKAFMDKTKAGRKLYYFLMTGGKISDLIIILPIIILGIFTYNGSYILLNSITMLASSVAFGFSTFTFLRKYPREPRNSRQHDFEG